MKSLFMVCTVEKCLSRLDFLENVFLQVIHWWSLLFSCNVETCCFSFTLHVNDMLQKFMDAVGPFSNKMIKRHISAFAKIGLQFVSWFTQMYSYTYIYRWCWSRIIGGWKETTDKSGNLSSSLLVWQKVWRRPVQSPHIRDQHNVLFQGSSYF